MEDYDNLYALKGIQGKDLDGDGLKDLVVFGKYSYEGKRGIAGGHRVHHLLPTDGRI